jgi:hypothetical protein
MIRIRLTPMHHIAHVARAAADGEWRVPDSLGYNEHVGAVAAITAQHLEEALSARFGLEWVARDDGNGFEISGISGEMMRVFSSRRESITVDLRARAGEFERRYGRAPSQREVAQLAQASNFRTRKNKEGAIDVAQLHAGWADKLARTLGVRLASLAPSVWHADAGHADAGPRGAEDPGALPGELELSRAAQRAVALAQQEKSTWTRADVIKYLGRVPCPDPAGTRPRPAHCWRTWRTGRWPRSSSRSCAWKHQNWRWFRAACRGRTGAASTSGTAASATPRAPSWAWKTSWSRVRRPGTRRA